MYSSRCVSEVLEMRPAADFIDKGAMKQLADVSIAFWTLVSHSEFVLDMYQPSHKGHCYTYILLTCAGAPSSRIRVVDDTDSWVV